MKAISLHQPWASLMMLGLKQVETRGWATKHRGPLLIHAAQAWSPEQDRIARQYLPKGTPIDFGKLIALVTIDEVVPTASTSIWINGWINRRIVIDGRLVIPRSEYTLGNYGSGRFAWLTSRHERLDAPIPYRGLQGLFEVPEL